MKWIKFIDDKPDTNTYYNSDKHFLVTDGIKVYCAYLDKFGNLDFHADINENYYEVENRLTHWHKFENISLPNQPERSKREDS